MTNQHRPGEIYDFQGGFHWPPGKTHAVIGPPVWQFHKSLGGRVKFTGRVPGLNRGKRDMKTRSRRLPAVSHIIGCVCFLGGGDRNDTVKHVETVFLLGHYSPRKSSWNLKKVTCFETDIIFQVAPKCQSWSSPVLASMGGRLVSQKYNNRKNSLRLVTQ